MSSVMEYKGYVGSVEFSPEDELFFGKVQGVRALISYEGKDAKSLLEDFYAAVDDYIAMCEVEDVVPEKAYKGSFNVRISPELHKQAAIAAMSEQMSLNALVESSIRQFVAAHC